MSSEFQTVGVVGVGAMGSVFVEHFIAAGAKLFVYDVTPAAVERAESLGAIACATPAELARECDIVHVMVLDDQQTLDVCLGENGALQTLREGKPLLLHSSIQPYTTQTIAQTAAEKGVPVADACIVAIPAQLRMRKAAALFGGDEALFERVKPHLLLLAEDIFHMGGLGSGNVAKGANNTLLIAPAFLVRECIEVMMGFGISFEKAKAIAERQNGRPLGFDTVEQMRSFYDTGIAGNLFDPILPIVAAAAKDHGVRAPLIQLLASAKEPLE